MSTQLWTPRRAASKARRKLTAIRELLLGIAYLWGDEDAYIDALVGETLEKCNDIADAVVERLGEDAS